ncbi:MAG: GNAT family N-acetyltransferase, partial [Deltaproteobacteria bacterium]
MSKIIIRKATIEDAKLLLNFVYELAKYQKAEHKVEADREQI